MNDLERKREDFAQRWKDLRQAVESEVGVRPRADWIGPAIGVAVGLLGAVTVKRKLAKRRVKELE